MDDDREHLDYFPCRLSDHIQQFLAQNIQKRWLIGQRKRMPGNLMSDYMYAVMYAPQHIEMHEMIVTILTCIYIYLHIKFTQVFPPAQQFLISF